MARSVFCDWARFEYQPSETPGTEARAAGFDLDYEQKLFVVVRDVVGAGAAVADGEGGGGGLAETRTTGAQASPSRATICWAISGSWLEPCPRPMGSQSKTCLGGDFGGDGAAGVEPTAGEEAALAEAEWE